MQKKQKPETLYRKLLAQGFIPDDAVQQLMREGYSSQQVARAVALDLKQKMARTNEFLLKDPSNPYLNPRTYETFQEIILGIVNKKAPRATTLSAKTDFVIRSLDKTAISIALEEVETTLDEHTEGRATQRTMQGIYLALAINHFGYDPTARYQKDVIKEIKKAVFPEQLHRRKDDTIRDHLRDAAKVFPNAKKRIPN